MIQLAGIKASVEAAQLLLTAAPKSIHEQSYSGGMPLHIACQSCVPDAVVRLFLDEFAGAPNQRGNNGELPLHVAAECGSSLQVVQWLCEAAPQGCIEPVSNKDGRLPLHFAVGRGPLASYEVTHYLLSQCPESATEVDGSADAHSQVHLMRNGALPLHRAVEAGVPETVIRLLLDRYPEGLLVRENRGLGRLAVEAISEQQSTLATVFWEKATAHFPEAPEVLSRPGAEANPTSGLLQFFHAMATHPPCAEAVVDILTQHPHMAEWRNERNFITYDVASAQVRAYIQQSRCFLGRYDHVRPAHSSATSVVLLATDVNHDSNQRVALKLMRSEEQFLQEVEMRHKHKLDEKYVVSILRVHVEEQHCSADLQTRLKEQCSDVRFEKHAFGAYLERVKSHGLVGCELDVYGYCLVLEQADRTLQDAITHEDVKGKWPQIIKIGADIANALQHLHEKKVIHGDLKPLNVVGLLFSSPQLSHENLASAPDTKGQMVNYFRILHVCVRGTWRMIDLDFSCEIGQHFGPKRPSTAYSPPEFAMLLENEEEMNFKASVAHDLWSLGCVLVRIFACISA
eukprot:scaffold38791_cov19-Prasinocladus_malaysianus.AAC.1